MATLVLNNSEIGVLDKHFTTTLQNLQRLHDKTPQAVVHLLAGALPFRALLHLRQMSEFSMICHMPGNPLHIHARHVLALSPPSSHSWFLRVRDICRQYSLPHPLQLLETPLGRIKLKKIVKLKILEYWHQKFSTDCSPPNLTSVKYLDPRKCSLLTPHPVWTSAGGSSYESNKSLVVAKMISGRYRRESLCRFWSSNTA